MTMALIILNDGYCMWIQSNFSNIVSYEVCILISTSVASIIDTLFKESA
jgi:hypothetical protein